MQNINERQLIIYALIDITKEGAYNNITLYKMLGKNIELSAVQKNFITEVVNGVLRNLIYIDYIIDCYASLKTTKMKPVILNILRSAVYQIYFMDKVPFHAICDESVKLANKLGFKSLRSFINGIIRNIMRDKDKLELPNKDENPILYLSIKYSIPQWILEYWQKEFDLDSIEVLCENSVKRPKVSICVNSLKTNMEQLVGLLNEENVKAEFCCDNGLQINGGVDIKNSECYQKGYYHVMDKSSMEVVKMMEPKPNNVLIDLCAGPGGKTFYAAYSMENMGKIYACDIYPHKLDLMREACSRLGISIVEFQEKDSSILDANKKEIADIVLVDAPCSGFGLMRKKPDIKYTRSMDDVKSLAILQKELLKNASEYVKVGGILLYSTCTISKTENQDNMDWFVKNYPFEIVKVKQLLPPNWDGDGFFIAKLKKKKEGSRNE